MVIKEFLLNNSIDISRFSNCYLKPDKVRRSTLKMPGIFSLKIIGELEIIFL